MEHSFLDRYSGLDSFVHRLDPRTKIVIFSLFILSVIFTSPVSLLSFGFYAVMLLVLILASRVPPGFVLKRLLGVVPFVAVVAVFIPFLKKGQIAGSYSFGSLRLTVSYDGLVIFWNVLIKSCLSVLAMTILSNTTRFSDFLKGLERLRFPAVMTVLLSFMYRYLFVFVDELMRMRRAMEARGAAGTGWSRLKALSQMIGVLLVRAYECGERVYAAMCSRGFDGQVRTLASFRIKCADVCFAASVAACLVFAWLL